MELENAMDKIKKYLIGPQEHEQFDAVTLEAIQANNDLETKYGLTTQDAWAAVEKRASLVKQPVCLTSTYKRFSK